MASRRGLPGGVKMRHDQKTVRNLHYVDGLVCRDGEAVGRMLPLSDLRPNPDQPRKDLGDLESLVGSVKEHGVLEPLLVKKDAVGYIIISGERRYHASKQAELESVPCIIKNLDQAQILEIALVENLQRKDLHPFEEADGLKTLLESFEYTHDRIAKKIGKSRSSVTEMLTIAGMEEAVREAAKEADITAKSMLLSIARLETVEEQLEMIASVAAGNYKRDDVRRKAKKQQRAKPFVFKYRAPNKSFSFDMKFKKSEVPREELIETLEQVLDELRTEAADGGQQ